MNSMGGLFSNLKQKIEQKIEKKPNNSGSGAIIPLENDDNNNYGVPEIKSLKDSAQRIDAILSKYQSSIAGPDINEFKAIIQYLYNYK